ncbi:unnamed protein product [Brachionus calyciflorus]|uniref:NEDD8-activating enzyme E1 regulatory subunit n=1 Tax=Brachionus calyciflorus TaxID=104777 RepID=A0A813M451_9BILA|nr:unnamed protein product [Brachionus calyciflorus]
MSNNPAIENHNSQIATDKNAKYDRQLRLWGNHGQAKLENSRICLINASAAGTETLKSMVLPGVGYFSIIDDNSVTKEDVAKNFFVTYDSIGQSRAKVASENLCELNPDVIGDYLAESIDRILENKPEYLRSFNLIIATNLKESSFTKLAEYLWNENIPLISIRSFGLVGFIRIIAKEHNVIEAHPDNELPVLRLDQPFDELKNYCNSIDLNSLSEADHAHIPFLIILYKYLEIWKNQNEGKIPRTYKEKEAFKELIKTGILRNEESIPKFEENFEEALKNVNNSITVSQIPSEIKTLFNDEKCLNLNEKSDKFWIIIRAIKEFTENEGMGHLPLRGTLPDMFSDSDKYIAIQNVYKAKAQQDIEAVLSRVERLLLNINKPYDYINEQEVKLYCKNAYFLKNIRYRSLSKEYDPQTSNIGSLMEENSDSDLVFYILMRAVDSFHAENNRYPGTNSDILHADGILLKKHLYKLMQENRLNFTIKEEYIHEICRYGNSEIHSISAYLGGCAAHEAIKLLTNQFVPINNTLIYNGIKQSTTVYEL